MNDTEYACNHVVRELFAQIKERGLSVGKVEHLAGLGTNVMPRWKKGKEPLLGNVLAALNGIGLDLRVVPLDKK